MEVALSQLPEPLLQFGGPDQFSDPKRGLATCGPFSVRYEGGHPGQVRLGIVGPAEAVDAGLRWFERCRKPILSAKENRQRFPDYPGFEATFRSPLETTNRWVEEISMPQLAVALTKPSAARFDAVVDLFAEGVSRLARREMGPNVVLCSLSDEILKQCGQLIRELPASARGAQRRLRSKTPAEQLSLPFDTEDDDALNEAEALLYRSFRRALKARVMTQSERLPIQIAHSHLYKDGPGKDDPATRAWSVSVALFYKAGGLPWRLAYVQPHVCFVGLSFHRLVTTKRNMMYGSVAQAFSTEIEGFVLRGERIDWEPGQEPHLSEQQSFQLGQSVLSEYRERAGREPVRITLHKTTQFSEEERTGFTAAFASVATLELLTLQVADLRVLTLDDYPVERGTLCSINGRHFLYTTGFYRDWGTYPGPHVPAPVEVRGHVEATDLRRVCEETLALSKMNWNSASIGDRDPITLSMASRVGPIMAEVPEDQQPELSYRYYM